MKDNIVSTSIKEKLADFVKDCGHAILTFILGALAVDAVYQGAWLWLAFVVWVMVIAVWTIVQDNETR